MARREPAGPGTDAQQDEDREQRLAALRIRLQDGGPGGPDRRRTGPGACRQPPGCPAESWANVLLISSRMPDATLVKGYEAWRAAGRQVNRNEKGIEIFSDRAPAEGKPPRPRGRRAWPQLARRGPRRLRLGPVPDQRPAPSRPDRDPSPTGAVPPGLWDCLCWLARREGFAVEREPGCPDDGTTLWTARRIRVPPGPGRRPGHLGPGPPARPRAPARHDRRSAGHLHNRLPGSRRRPKQTPSRSSSALATASRSSTAFASPQTWAGTDPRAQPGATILAAGERITTAAARISRYLDHHLPGRPPAWPHRAGTVALTAVAVRPSSSAERDRQDRGRPAGRRSSSTSASSPEAGHPPTSASAASPPRRWGSGTSDTPPADGPR